MSRFDITVVLVQELINDQFPKWANLAIKEVPLSGNDNMTFRLGDDMLIRLPRAEMYARKVHIEQKWLPILDPHISLQIPVPLALGRPSDEYPFPWSVYKWIPGESANSLDLSKTELIVIAQQLASFLKELHQIDTAGAPEAGPQNFFRGAHPSVYDTETRQAISNLQGIINVEAATVLWEKALASKWGNRSVWIHGDLSSGNILVKEGQLTAVIDFGGTGIGDPACDLVIAWTFLEVGSRDLFKSQIDLDPETWARARGWALWKALITIDSLKDKTSEKSKQNFRVVEALLKEHKSENGV